jgi:hypothetical protein
MSDRYRRDDGRGPPTQQSRRFEKPPIERREQSARQSVLQAFRQDYSDDDDDNVNVAAPTRSAGRGITTAPSAPSRHFAASSRRKAGPGSLPIDSEVEAYKLSKEVRVPRAKRIKNRTNRRL